MRLSAQHACIAAALACTTAFLPTASAEVAFETRTTGVCRDKSDWHSINDENDCQEGARALGMGDHEVDAWKIISYPYGCFWLSNSAGGVRSLVFNREPEAKPRVCNEHSKCICGTTSSACENTDGSVPNIARCICGNKVCKVEPCPLPSLMNSSVPKCEPNTKGMYCVSATNTCSKRPPVNCPIADGSAANPSACMCGTVDCDESVGMHCDMSRNRCSQFPVCAIANGSAPNPSSCACGSVDCDESDGTTGMHCYISQNRCRKGQVCAITDGSAPNPSSCACGDIDCEAETNGLICTAATSTCSTGDCSSEEESLQTPNCASKNQRCQCIRCIPGFYSSDCSKKCREPVVAIALDAAFVALALWFFLGTLYCHFYFADDLDKIADASGDTDEFSGRGGEIMTTALGRKATSISRVLLSIVLNQMQIVASVLASIVWSPELPPFLIDLVNYLQRVFILNVPDLLTSPDCMYSSANNSAAIIGRRMLAGNESGMLGLYSIINVSNLTNNGGNVGGDVGGMTPMNKWWMSLLIPVCVSLAFPLWYHCIDMSKNRRAKLTVIKVSMQVVYVWLFVAIVTACLRILDCTPDDLGDSRLILDPTFPCPLGGYDGSDASPAVFAMIVFFLYTVPFILKLFTLSCLSDSWWDDPTNRALWSWAVEDYKIDDDQAWAVRRRIALNWESVVVLTKIFMVGGSVLMYPENRFITHITTMSVVLGLQLLVRPYADLQCNVSATLFTICDVVGIVSAFSKNAALQIVFISILLLVILTMIKPLLSSWLDAAKTSFQGLSSWSMFVKFTSTWEKVLVAPYLLITCVLSTAAMVLCCSCSSNSGVGSSLTKVSAHGSERGEDGNNEEDDSGVGSSLTKVSAQGSEVGTINLFR